MTIQADQLSLNNIIQLNLPFELKLSAGGYQWDLAAVNLLRIINNFIQW